MNSSGWLARWVTPGHAEFMFSQASDWLYELAFRESDGIEVALLWDGAGDTVLLNVRDARAGEWFICTVDGGRALDAFRHPFAYVGRRRDGAPRLRATA